MKILDFSKQLGFFKKSKNLALPYAPFCPWPPWNALRRGLHMHDEFKRPKSKEH